MSDLVERLRDEADLCRSETADDIARLIDEAADELGRLTALLAEQEREIERLRIANEYWHNRLESLRCDLDAALAAGQP